MEEIVNELTMETVGAVCSSAVNIKGFCVAALLKNLEF